VNWLRRWLYLVGFIQLSAIVSVFMPKSWMDACSSAMGVTALEDTPIAGYLARLSSAMYVVHGMLLVCLAGLLPEQLRMVHVFSRTTFGLAFMMLWIDVIEGMPTHWTWFEFIALFGNATIMELLARHAVSRS
jgi:hypothetical protein